MPPGVPGGRPSAANASAELRKSESAQSEAGRQSVSALSSLDGPNSDSEVDSDDDDDDDDSDMPEELRRAIGEEEVNADVLLAQLEVNMYATHPQMQDPRRLIPDFDLETAIRAKRHASVRFNSQFVMAPGRRKTETLEPRQPPGAIVATGHRGRGGNVGLNGIYELYPEAFCHRPVYQKMLEKRELTSVQSEPSFLRERTLHDRKSRLEAGKSQTKFIIKAAPRPRTPTGMQPVRDAYFLFFDRSNGCWNIGPCVGHSEVFARCPGTEELLPDKLNRWEVWDVGKKEWCESLLRTHAGSGPDRDYSC